MTQWIMSNYNGWHDEYNEWWVIAMDDMMNIMDDTMNNE